MAAMTFGDPGTAPLPPAQASAPRRRPSGLGRDWDDQVEGGGTPFGSTTTLSGMAPGGMGVNNPWGARHRANYGGGGAGGGTGHDRLRRSALDALAEEIRGGYQPERVAAPDIITSGSTEPYDRAAETASYGRAKERTGLAAQAAMKGLRGQMSRRGIGGSGIEGEATGRLFEAGLGDLAETDRTLAEGAAGRAFTAEQANTDRRIGQTRYNTDLERWYQDANIDAQGRRMSLLAQIYGSYY